MRFSAFVLLICLWGGMVQAKSEDLQKTLKNLPSKADAILGRAPLKAKKGPKDPFKTLTFSASRFSPYANRFSLEEGIITELVRQVFREKGFHVDVRFDFQEEALDHFLNNESVAYFPVFMIKKFPKEEMLLTKIMPLHFHVYTKSQNKLAEKIARRSKKAPHPKKEKIKVCIPAPFLQLEGMQEALDRQAFKLITHKTAYECVADLRENRVDGIIDEEMNANAMGLESNVEDLIVLLKSVEPFYTTHVYIGFRKGLKGIHALKSSFDKELHKMKKNGDLADLIRRFREFWSIVH